MLRTGKLRKRASVVHRFASYILITVGVFSLWEAGIGTAAWVGCARGSGFVACGEPAKAAQDTIRGLITLGLGLLYQNQNEP